ncbi:response regulator [Salipaludibacillus sp. HK11]|uniref:response regulator n=1 Tax=Salipaludibacillus sp. HK11 TaxID=3394320 RepID=UPI0039FBE2E6
MKNLSVLVCDDSELVRKQMIEVLTLIGVENILEAYDGEQAVIICKKQKPDLVFMDIIMPKKDGIAALKQITQSNSTIKVVMASSSSSHSHLKKSLQLGAYTFIQKPISEKVILNIIQNLIEKRTIFSKD